MTETEQWLENLKAQVAADQTSRMIREIHATCDAAIERNYATASQPAATPGVLPILAPSTGPTIDLSRLMMKDAPMQFDDVLLQVPTFARLVDYCGAWAIEESAASRLVAMANGMRDWAEHMAQFAAVGGNGKATAQRNADDIAVIPVSGILMKSRTSMGGTSTIDVRRAIRAAAVDPKITAIILTIDSPGGTVSGTFDLAEDVRRARAFKPTWCAIEDLGASAAYWVASQCERITINAPTAMAGSIGTIQVIRDFSEAGEKEGVRTIVLSTGSLKGTGAPGAPVTDEQVAYLQRLVDSAQQSFDAAVMSGRKLTAAQLAAVRHGGLLSATDALAAKLVDAIQPLGVTLNELAGRRGGGRPATSRT